MRYQFHAVLRRSKSAPEEFWVDIMVEYICSALRNSAKIEEILCHFVLSLVLVLAAKIVSSFLAVTRGRARTAK